MPQIFLDCDGVLADFDTAAEAIFGMPSRLAEETLGTPEFWRRIHATDNFFRSLPRMADADRLYTSVLRRRQSPVILTGVPSSYPGVAAQKLAWRDEHFPAAQMICCASADKRNHAQPGDILIDDWLKYRHLWEEMGGVFIHHTSAAASIAALDSLGV